MISGARESAHTTPSFSVNEMPTTEIVIPLMVYEKINHWVQMGNAHECSGLGITRIEDGKIYISDAIMLKQKNTGATTDIEDSEINKAMFKLHKQGAGDGQLNFWWHSHADMSVFWSGTDKDTIAQIGKHGMCVAIVFNKKREMRAAIACIKPFNLFVDNVKVSVESVASKELIESWTKEYEENVAKPNYGGSVGYLGRGTWYNRDDEAWNRGGFNYDRDNIAKKDAPTQLPSASASGGNGTNAKSESDWPSGSAQEPGSLFDKRPGDDDEEEDELVAQMLDDMPDDEFYDMFGDVHDYDHSTGEYVMKDGSRITEQQYDTLQNRYFKLAIEKEEREYNAKNRTH